jgi:Fe-S cluster biogenesis protein NfuA
MSRTDEEIIQAVKELIETRIQPAVSSHGGIINFVSYKDAHLLLELSGACAGCAGSTATLKHGVENMVKHYIPEVETVDATHDANSGVDPYYVDNSIMIKEIK